MSIQHFGAAPELGMETVGFLMLAHRIAPGGAGRAGPIMVDAGASASTSSTRPARWSSATPRPGSQRSSPRSAHQAQVGFHGHQNLSLGVANSVLAVQHGATQVDGALAPFGAGAGNSPTEVLAATFDHLGIPTGIDVQAALAAAEDVVRPFLHRLPFDGPGLDHAGLGRGLLQLPAARRAGRPAYGVPPTRSCSESASSATSAARRT